MATVTMIAFAAVIGFGVYGLSAMLFRRPHHNTSAGAL